MGLEGKHTPETLVKPPTGFGGVGQIRKFLFEVGQMFSGSLESGHTFVVGFLECTEFASSLPGREGKSFQSNCLPHDLVYQEWEEG